MRDGAAVAIVGNRIAEVGPDADLAQRWRPARSIDASGHVVGPGFVDAHVHLGAYLGVGPYRRQTAPGPFSGAGDTAVILPMVAGMCAARPPEELVAAAVRPALAAMLLAGITAVVDAGGPSPDGVVSAAADLGIRAAVGPSLADHWHDTDGRIVRQADPADLLADAEAFVERHRVVDAGTARVRPLVSAVATAACSDELLAGVAELADRHDLPLQRDHAGRDDALSLETALAMATNGSVPLGRPGRLGSLRAGQLADLVLVDVTGAHHLGIDHPVPALTLHARPGDVDTVIVDGRVVVDGGVLTTADEAGLVAAAGEARRALAGPAA